MKHWYFLVGSLLVICSSVSFSSASFLEKETDGNIIKLGSRKIIRQMKRINLAKEVHHGGSLYKNCADGDCRWVVDVKYSDDVTHLT